MTPPALPASTQHRRRRHGGRALGLKEARFANELKISLMPAPASTVPKDGPPAAPGITAADPAPSTGHTPPTTAPRNHRPGCNPVRSGFAFAVFACFNGRLVCSKPMKRQASRSNGITRKQSPSSNSSTDIALVNVFRDRELLYENRSAVDNKENGSGTTSLRSELSSAGQLCGDVRVMSDSFESGAARSRLIMLNWSRVMRA